MSPPGTATAGVDASGRPGMRSRVATALVVAPRWPVRSARAVLLMGACLAMAAAPLAIPGTMDLEPAHAALLLMLGVAGLRLTLPAALATAVAAEAVLAAQRVTTAVGDGEVADAIMAVAWTLLGALVAGTAYALSEAPRRRERAAADAAAQSILRALATKDSAVGDHSHGVAELAVAVGRRLGMPEAQLADLEVAAYLHDLGKLAVPQDILDRAGPLTPGERDVVRRHPEAGEQIVGGISALAHLGPVLRAMHERWDGGGYPDGAAGEAIPLPARIVFACDAFEAMVDARPYDPGRLPQEAARELARAAGTQFDPEVVAALLAVLGDRGVTPAPGDQASRSLERSSSASP